MLQWLLITLHTSIIHAMFRGYNILAHLQHPLSLVFTPLLGLTYNLPLITFPILYGALRLALHASFATQALLGLVVLHATTLHLPHLWHCHRCLCCTMCLLLALPSFFLAVHLSSLPLQPLYSA